MDGVKETINHKTNRRLKQFEEELSSHYTNFIGISSTALPLVMNNEEECVSLQSSQDNVNEFIQFYILQKFFDYVLSGAKKTVDGLKDGCGQIRPEEEFSEIEKLKAENRLSQKRD